LIKEFERNKIKRALSGSAKVTYSRGRGTLALIKEFERNKIKRALSGSAKVTYSRGRGTLGIGDLSRS
jgi:hypothetical protein